MITIIGCGNPNRSDDGVGSWVATQLIPIFKNKSDKIQVFDAGTSGVEVMFKARGSKVLIIVDANMSGSEPGTIFEVPGNEVENIPEPSFNMHDFRWDNALYVGRKMYVDDFPSKVSVFLLEAQTLEFGTELSEVVKNACERLIELIIQKVKEYELKYD